MGPEEVSFLKGAEIKILSRQTEKKTQKTKT